MSGLLSKPTMPAAATAAPPSVATPAVQAASDAQRLRSRAAAGRASTMLTSTEDRAAGPLTGTKKLLGM